MTSATESLGEEASAGHDPPRTASTQSSSSLLPSAPELTGRSILSGILVGSLLCFTNCYFGLQSSWISMSSMQAALVGYGIVRLLPGTAEGEGGEEEGVSAEGRTRTDGSWFRRWFGTGRFTPQENVVLQTTAVALGSMPLTAGLVGIVPALLQLNPAKDAGAQPINLMGWQLLLWCAALAFFGVFFASPLRKQVIIKEKLTFPSGTATAHLIAVLHDVKLRDEDGGEMDEEEQAKSSAVAGSPHDTSRRRNGTQTAGERTPLLSPSSHSRKDGKADDNILRGSRGWKTLLWSFASSLLFTLSSALFPVLYAIPVFDILPPHNLASRWGWYFTPSLSYVGQGIIMGLETTMAMIAGAIFGWAFLSPLAHHSGWTDAEPMDAENGAKGWILWISLAIMTAESLIGLAVVMLAEIPVDRIRGYLNRSFRQKLEGSQSAQVDEDDEPPHRLPPTKIVTLGLILSSLFALWAIWVIFGREGIEPWTTIIAILLAFALSVLAVRSLGSTDLNPVAALGKISQLVFAFLQPHNVVAGLIAGGLSEGSGMEAGELLQAAKTGHLLRASPRAQFQSQLIGSFFGIFISAMAYQLYVKVYTIPSTSFPVPAAAMWLNFARLVNNGEIPRHSQEWMIGTAAVFTVTGVVKSLAQAKALKRAESQRRRRQRKNTRSAEGTEDEISDEQIEERYQAGDEQPAKWEQWSHYLPSGVAFAVGILNTPNFSIARFLGGLLSYWWARRNRPTSSASPSPSATSPSNILIILVASGFVLGEGAGSILNLFGKQLVGWGAVSCAGCRGSCGGGC